mmetsp:Transcript_24408/g.36870  ORF Transcript_24408/g.36870 Transcript_24408/m.36870 type:complete len:153 (-) Transcript_24408:710-1168(-)
MANTKDTQTSLNPFPGTSVTQQEHAGKIQDVTGGQNTPHHEELRRSYGAATRCAGHKEWYILVVALETQGKGLVPKDVTRSRPTKVIIDFTKMDLPVWPMSGTACIIVQAGTQIATTSQGFFSSPGPRMVVILILCRTSRTIISTTARRSLL